MPTLNSCSGDLDVTSPPPTVYGDWGEAWVSLPGPLEQHPTGWAASAEADGLTAWRLDVQGQGPAGLASSEAVQGSLLQPLTQHSPLPAAQPSSSHGAVPCASVWVRISPLSKDTSHTRSGSAVTASPDLDCRHDCISRCHLHRYRRSGLPQRNC